MYKLTKMTRKGASRLARHYKFLQGVPNKGLRMEHWFVQIKDNAPEVPQKQDAECGTAACVAGWLVVSDKKNWASDMRCLWGRPVPRLKGRVVICPDPFEDFAWYAEMDERDSYRICDPAEYAGCDRGVPKSKVLERIVKVAKEYGWDITSGKAVKIGE